MDYQKIPSTDLMISRVGLGTWAMGDDFFGKVEDADSIAAIHAAIDSGINLIDTAPSYGSGRSESVVGKAIKGRRDKVIIATKCGNRRTENGFVRDFSPEFLKSEIHEQLKRLGTEYIDMYFVHWPDPSRPVEPGIEILKKLQEEGKFRYFALSNFSIKRIEQIRSLIEVVCLQPQYSLLHRYIEQDILPYCREHEIGIMSYGTLAGGILTGKFKNIPQFEETDKRSKFYKFFEEPIWSRVLTLVKEIRHVADSCGCTPGQVAINWSLQQSGISSVLVGAKHPQQVLHNAAAREFPLSNEALDRIDGAFEKFKEASLSISK